VPLHTIAFGTPAQVDDDLMRAMGLETSGASYQAVSATTIFDTFGMTLVSILKGNTVSITTRRHDTLTGPGPSTPTSVSVDRSAQRVMFSVQWAPPTRFALDLDVFPPGAQAPAARGVGDDPAQHAARGAERQHHHAGRRHPPAARREDRLVQRAVAAPAHHAERGRGDPAQGAGPRDLCHHVRRHPG